MMPWHPSMKQVVTLDYYHFGKSITKLLVIQAILAAAPLEIDRKKKAHRKSDARPFYRSLQVSLVISTK